MQQGTVISATGHAALIALAIFGLPERARDMEPARAQVSDVSIVSLEAFEAARSSAPESHEDPAAAIKAPEADTQPEETPVADLAPVVPEADIPDAPSTELAPDTSGLEIAQPTVSTVVDAPVASVDAGRIGLETPLRDAAPVDGSINSSATALLMPERPNLAPRIDTKAAPKPPEPAKEAETVVEDTTKEADATKPPKEPEDAAAPKESAVETVPDAKPEENPTTPMAAARPRGRPASLQADAEQRQQAEKEAIAAALAAAAKEEANTETAAASAPAAQPAETGSRLGDNFNSSQSQAVGDAVGQFWNKSLIEGKDGYEKLVVIVRVKLTASGTIIGGVEAVEPRSPQGDFKIAYDAARRAVIRAAAKGIPLPKDIFRDGDYLEIRFDPSRSAISLN